MADSNLRDDDHFWSAPDGVIADDLTSSPPSGNEYQGIPAFANGDFEARVDAPAASVPDWAQPRSPELAPWLAPPETFAAPAREVPDTDDVTFGG